MRQQQTLLVALTVLTCLNTAGLGYLIGSKNHPSRSSLDSVVIANERSRKNHQTPYEQHHVRNAITKQMIQLRECYSAFLKSGPSATDGQVTVDWFIRRLGAGDTVELVSSSFASDDLHQCIVDKMNTWKFPPPPGGQPVYTSFTFNFKKDQ